MVTICYVVFSLFALKVPHIAAFVVNGTSGVTCRTLPHSLATRLGPLVARSLETAGHLSTEHNNYRYVSLSLSLSLSLYTYICMYIYIYIYTHSRTPSGDA